MGWRGIHVNANPLKHSKCFLMRSDEVNLNFAVGEVDGKFVNVD
jgi:hypothetical protein